jgi:hypothetical protein
MAAWYRVGGPRFSQLGLERDGQWCFGIPLQFFVEHDLFGKPGFHFFRIMLQRSSRRGAREQVLLDNGVDAPVAVDNLGDAEVDADRD